MWNYMGWDNASTIAQEVENPQRTYPRAMIVSTILVAVVYVLPLAAIALAGLPVDSFSTGDWITAATRLGGPLLGMSIAAGGVITGIGMFNALVMSYTRLPMAMAEDGMLPRVLARRNSRSVPWVSVLLCGVAWVLALSLTFERLITMDLILYGSSLLLEFVALVVLRIKEPGLARPFKAGSLAFAILLGVGPAALIGFALWASRMEEVMVGHNAVSALLFSLCVALLGPILYRVSQRHVSRRLAPEPVSES
jgi:amino acid transporter